MKLPLVQLWRSVRASYWFVPSLMLVISIALGAVMVWLDSGPAAGVLDGLRWYQQSKPEGAREVLSEIAGSMITVGGVVFSITIVAIAYAASQYGPRILTNFMRDRGNQVTLGTFLATFAYSIVVLRTIYGGEDAFVPQLAVIVALVLALCSIAVLIYFIHHVPESIHVNTITARIGRGLVNAVQKEFPTCVGDPPEPDDANSERLAELAERCFADRRRSIAIAAGADGYLQAIDSERILEVACEHDLVLRLERSPGQFLCRGECLVRATPRERVTEQACDALRESWSIASNRTPDQDSLFLVDELVEIAARALSAGINDPHTAMTCVDWLSAAASELARRQPPSPFRLSADGTLRVIAQRASFATHIARGFGAARPYLARDVNAATHTLERLAAVSEQCAAAEYRHVLTSEGDALFALARAQNEGPSRERLEAVMAELRPSLDV